LTAYFSQDIVATDLTGGGILSEVNGKKNYENWSTFAEVIIKIKTRGSSQREVSG